MGRPLNPKILNFMKKNIISFSLLIVISIAGYAQKTDAYGGFMDIKGEKTGYFHAEQINDRWSLVTPDGHAFYGIGMAHPITGFTQSAVHFVFADDQEAWLKGSIQRMRDLGFNVTEIANADRMDYPTTRIIDYTGNPYTTQYLVNLLDLTQSQVLFQTLPDGEVDVALVIGYDWQALLAKLSSD